jgi:hypothetical protein
MQIYHATAASPLMQAINILCHQARHYTQLLQTSQNIVRRIWLGINHKAPANHIA